MKRLKYGMVCAALCLLIGASFTVAAETITDPSGDVWHWSHVGTAWSWVGNVGGKPNIDITEISYTVNNNKLTLSLKVSGTIQTSEKVVYMVYFNSTDTSYWLEYSNGTGGGWGIKKTGMNFTSAENVTISGNTLSIVLDALGDTSKVDLWGYAFEYTLVGDQTTNEWWGDWAPNTKIPFSTTQDGNTGNDTGDNTGNNTGGNAGKGTPGFEVLPVIAAVAIAAILLRRRR